MVYATLLEAPSSPLITGQRPPDVWESKHPLASIKSWYMKALEGQRASILQANPQVKAIETLETLENQQSPSLSILSGPSIIPALPGLRGA